MADNNSVQSLYQFMTQMNRNNVRSNNLFEMRVFLPLSLRMEGGQIGKAITEYLNPNFTFYGQGFELPGRTIQYQDVGFKGFTVPVPTVVKMDQEHTVTINCDIKGDMRRAFLAWQSTTINPTIEDGKGYFEGNRHLNASSMIKIYLLDPEYGSPQKITDVYTIFGVTVENVGTMTLSNTEANIATFQVKFRSQYWQYGDTTLPVKGDGKNNGSNVSTIGNLTASSMKTDIKINVDSIN